MERVKIQEAMDQIRKIKKLNRFNLSKLFNNEDIKKYIDNFKNEIKEGMKEATIKSYHDLIKINNTWIEAKEIQEAYILKNNDFTSLVLILNDSKLLYNIM